jgi:oligopeptide transport system substrate-binding protein
MDVTLMHNTSEGHALIAAAIQQMWKDNLGVEVRVENQEWKVYLDTLKNTTPLEDMPHIWRLGWCADYPDQNNWIHEVFNSDEGANRVRTDNADFNALTVAAGESQDPAERAALYEQAEMMFNEEMVGAAMIYHYTDVAVTKPYLDRNYPPLGGNDFFNWKLDGKTTLNWNFGTEPPSLDPSLATDTTSVDVIANTFVGLTKFDPVTGEVSPSLATSWEAGEDAEGNQTWTFTLREDIAWVHHDPVTGETTQVLDEEGNPRFVNAHDVVYGVKRTVNPETASDYSYVLYIIKNAAPINAGE